MMFFKWNIFDRLKVVEINALELELHVLLSEELEALLSQRRQRVAEQAECLQRLSCEQRLYPPVCNVFVIRIIFRLLIYNFSQCFSQCGWTEWKYKQWNRNPRVSVKKLSSLKRIFINHNIEEKLNMDKLRWNSFHETDLHRHSYSYSLLNLILFWHVSVRQKLGLMGIKVLEYLETQRFQQKRMSSYRRRKVSISTS